MSSFIETLSKSLFWDVDRETVDEYRHRRFVIERVLSRGKFADMKSMISHYTMPVVIAEAQQSRSLDPVTLSFAACLGNVKEESFRCFASTQSNLRPWNS